MPALPRLPVLPLILTLFTTAAAAQQRAFAGLAGPGVLGEFRPAVGGLDGFADPVLQAGQVVAYVADVFHAAIVGPGQRGEGGALCAVGPLPCGNRVCAARAGAGVMRK